MAKIETNVDLTQVDSGMPILVAGVKTARIVDMQIVENKKKDGNNLNIELRLTQPDTTREGKPVNADFPIFDLISLRSTDKYDPNKRLKELQEAVGITTPDFDTDDFVGKEVSINLTIEVDKDGQYGDKNRVKRYLKQK